jgi:hypothetical protein
LQREREGAIPVKIKSHQDKLGFALPTSPAAIFVDSFVDALADEATGRVRLTDHLRLTWTAALRKAERILLRFAVIDADLYSNFTHPVAQLLQEGGASAKPRKDVDNARFIRAATDIEQLGHTVIDLGRQVICVKCQRHLAASDLVGWRRGGPCPGAARR